MEQTKLGGILKLDKSTAKFLSDVAKTMSVPMLVINNNKISGTDNRKLGIVTINIDGLTGIKGDVFLHAKVLDYLSENLVKEGVAVFEAFVSDELQTVNVTLPGVGQKIIYNQQIANVVDENKWSMYIDVKGDVMFERSFKRLFEDKTGIFTQTSDGIYYKDVFYKTIQDLPFYDKLTGLSKIVALEKFASKSVIITDIPNSVIKEMVKGGTPELNITPEKALIRTNSMSDAGFEVITEIKSINKDKINTHIIFGNVNMSEMLALMSKYMRSLRIYTGKLRTMYDNEPNMDSVIFYSTLKPNDKLIIRMCYVESISDQEKQVPDEEKSKDVVIEENKLFDESPVIEEDVVIEDEGDGVPQMDEISPGDKFE